MDYKVIVEFGQGYVVDDKGNRMAEIHATSLLWFRTLSAAEKKGIEAAAEEWRKTHDPADHSRTTSFEEKKCVECGGNFLPKAAIQKRCAPCSDKKRAPRSYWESFGAAETPKPKMPEGKMGYECKCETCGESFTATGPRSKWCSKCKADRTAAKMATKPRSPEKPRRLAPWATGGKLPMARNAREAVEPEVVLDGRPLGILGALGTIAGFSGRITTDRGMEYEVSIHPVKNIPPSGGGFSSPQGGGKSSRQTGGAR